ncbi:hypothetical protein ACFYQ5_15975 [Streptomyces sp. NPDC005794]|uniref:hypothetical protein n=1 Tax=Streptomyces sp. NPDC005794 TaxID=3364733 RepID=UPI00367BAEF8
MANTEEPSVSPAFGTVVGDRKRRVGHFTAPDAALLGMRDGPGAHAAVLVTLAGGTGRGAWYTDMSMPSGHGDQLPKSLIVYDEAGKVLVELKRAGG